MASKLFHRPRKFASQPRYAASIDRSNDLGARVLSAYVGGRNVVNGLQAATVGTKSTGVDAQGVMTSLDGSSYLNLSSTGIFNDFTKPVTLAYFSKPLAAPTFAGTLRIAPASGSFEFCTLRGASGGGYEFAVGFADGNQLPVFTPATRTDGVAERFVLTAAGGMQSLATADYVLWQNRVKYTTSSIISFSAQSNDSTNYLGWDGADSNYAGLLDEFIIFDGVLTDRQISSYYDNPWQIFKATSRDIWLPVASGAINATPGAYTWSGTTATTSQLINGIIGPYTWSGTTSNVVAVVYATPGAYTWSGTTATTTQLVLATPGAYTWSGATATTSQLILATPGVYTWSGTTSVFASDINATPGAYTWSGTTATTTQFINAISGAYTWSGTNSTLSGAINATPGAYTWSGTTSGTIQLINASPGTYSWAGTTSTTSQAITSIVGAWSWAGTTSEIVAAITASPGAYTWSGTTSALFNAVNAMPGLWAWNGTTATTTQLVSQITGTYLWSGTTSGVIIPVILPISPGAWSWAGTTSTVPLPIRGAFVSTSDWTVVNQGNPPVTRRIQISGLAMTVVSTCCSFPTLIVSLVGSANGDSIRTMFGSWTATTNQTSTDSSWSAPDNAVLLSKAGYWKISVHGSATITSSASSVLNSFGTFIPEAIVNDTISQYYRPNPLSFSTAGKDPHWHDEFYVLSSGSTLAHIFMYDEAYTSSSIVTFTGTVTAQLCTP